MAGRATINIKAAELGLDLDGPAVNTVIDDLKRLEHEGYHFEAADASLELLMRRATGWEQEFFTSRACASSPTSRPAAAFNTEATVKVWVGEQRHVSHRRGQRAGERHRHGAAARRSAMPIRSSPGCTSPTSRCASSTGPSATGAVTRVLLDASDGSREWTTIGVSSNIIEASWRALEESHRVRPAARG